MMKVTGDKKKSAAKKGQRGHESKAECVCVCIHEWFCSSWTPWLSPHSHTHPHPLAYFIPTSPLLVHAAYPNPAFNFLTSLPGLSFTLPPPSSTLCVSISGLTLGQSLFLGLVARFPSGHGINSRLLTLTQPDWAKANLVSFSLLASFVHITFTLPQHTPNNR